MFKLLQHVLSRFLKSVSTICLLFQELAQICLRIHRILFFGTMFLCGMDPPVLKLHKTETGLSEYISVVEEVVTPKDQVIYHCTYFTHY